VLSASEGVGTCGNKHPRDRSPSVSAPREFVGCRGVCSKYKSRGVEAGNEAGAVTLNFRKEKMYASSTTTKPEKLDTENKKAAALMRALAVFELFTVILVFPQSLSFTTTVGLWG